MSEAILQRGPSQSRQEYYVIRIKGHLAPSWSETFEGPQLTQTRRGEALTTGAVADRAAPRYHRSYYLTALTISRSCGPVATISV